MKTEHYPDVRLCVQLTNLGFPKTEKSYGTEDNINFLNQEGGSIVCPNVMELLDQLPSSIRIGTKDEFDTYDLSIFKSETDKYEVRYNLYDDIDEDIESFNGNLANALAEMYLWLKEINYN